MTNVVIYFIGLIAHVTIPATNVLPERQVAVMIRDGNHQAEILVDTIAVLPTNNPFPSIKVDAATGRTHVPISGEISIVGVTTGGLPAQTMAFANDLISLKTVTKLPNLKLTQDVIDETSAGAAAYIDLSGGTLDVAGYYSKMGKHAQLGEVCLPSATFFSTSGTGSFIEFINDKGKHFRVRTGATIYITNLPDSAGAGHFSQNSTILENAANVGTLVEGGACTTKLPIFDPTSIGSKGADIECTNSHFP